MKTLLAGVVIGVVATLLVQRHKAWILSKLGINFPPKPPPSLP